MKSSKYLVPALIIIVFLFLLLFPSAAVTSARSGLMLWFKVILPTLLPFMIISRLLIETNSVSCLTFLFSAPFKKCFHVSKGGTFVIMTGFLCGYPMGAKLTADLYLHKQLNYYEAIYLLAFCNNLSPMFISSFLTLSCLEAPELLTFLVIIIYGVPILFALLTQPFYRKFSRRDNSVTENIFVSEYHFSFETIDTAIMDGFTQITKLGGYIILFSILSGMFLNFSLPTNVLALITGITEVTTGLNYIAVQNFSLPVRLLFCIPICVFGGLSGLMQTYSMIKDTDLPFPPYLLAKVIQSAIAVVCSILFIAFYF